MADAQEGAPFPPEIARPRGRPKKGETVTDVLKEYLDTERFTVKGRSVSAREMLVRKMYQLAMNGSIPAITYLWERMDGKIVQTIDQHIEAEIVIGTAPRPISDDAED